MCVLEQGKERKRVSEEEKRSQRQRLTDEELFYDPHMDEEDEQWVKRQRMAYHNGQYPCTTTVSTPDHNSQYVPPTFGLFSTYLAPTCRLSPYFFASCGVVVLVYPPPKYCLHRT